MRYTAYALDAQTRARILQHFPPRYQRVVADHITVQFDVFPDHRLPRAGAKIEIIGHADDGHGIEALVVRIDGTSLRPDGKIFHITLSLDPDQKPPLALDPSGRDASYRPVHSNALIMALGYTGLAAPFPIAAAPRMLESKSAAAAKPSAPTAP